MVLLGQNNAGKSNIAKALELALGAFWAGSHEPEDHEFFGRDRNQVIEITVRFDPADRLGGRYTEVVWRYNHAADDPVHFRGRPGDRGYPDGPIRNEDRDTCVCVVLEAERKLSYHLGYSSKWTYLSRLMHRFHKALMDHEETKNRLQQLFGEVRARFHDVPEFGTFVQELQEQLTDLVGSMTHKLEVDFEAYNPVNFFHALRLQAAEGDQPRTLEEMGTGEAQVLAMAFAYAYARAFHGGIVLVIEEPEAHLHPLAQEWLAKRLWAMAADGLQILITTHSPAFLDVMNLEGLVLVTKNEGATRVVQIDRQALVNHCLATGVPAGVVTVDNILPFYRANANREILEGFFARVVVLVEGPTEALALPVYMERRGLDVAKEGVAIIAVHGKGNLGKWRRLFRAYGIPCYVIFDNDAGDDGTSAKRRDALRAVGLGDNEHEQYVTTAEWTIRAEFGVFGASFEEALRQAFPQYADLEAAARQQGVESKPFLARCVAERMPMDEGVIGWQQMATLVAAIRGKLPAA